MGNDENEKYQKKESKFKINEGLWLDKFRGQSVNWVDKDLIKHLLNSFSISGNQFQRFINDRHGWITRKKSRVSYPNIREAADFLAIPPWLLFYRVDKGDDTEKVNQKLIDMFQTTPPYIPIFKIYRNDEAKKVRYYDKGNEINTEPHQTLAKQFGNENFSNHSVMEGTWKEIHDFLDKNYYDVNEKLTFSGAALIKVDENSHYKPLGTVRFKHKNLKDKDSYEENKNKKYSFWSAAWFTVDLKEKDVEKYKDLIEYIRYDLSVFIGSYPIVFQIQEGDRFIALYSWHSLRDNTSEELIITISQTIKDKLKHSKYPLDLSIACTNGNDNLSVSFDKELFNNVMKLISKDIKPKNFSRRMNTLQLLHEEAYIENGLKLELNYKISGKENVDEEVISATVVVENGIVKLKWDYDGQLYFITPLTQKIFNSFDIKPQVKQKNGNYFWGVVGDRRSLYQAVQGFVDRP